MHPEERYAMRLIKAGVSGYLTKNCSSEELINAIRRVSQGKKYISPSLAEELVIEVSREENKQPHEILSNRQYQVMIMLAMGKTINEIAAELSLSIKTVSTHRTNILKKMKLKNNVEITKYAINNQLIE